VIPAGARRALLVVLLALALVAVASVAGAGLEALRPLPAPPGAGSTAPGLASGPDGRAWLSWIEPRAGGGHRLRCAAWNRTRWSRPNTIAQGDSFFVNWADTPGLLALPDGRLLAHWPWRLGGDPYSYEVRLSQSRDGGVTWSRPVRAHGDASGAEHGFASMARDSGGAVLAWLDGRKGAGKPEGSAETELRAGRLTADGSVAGERVLDPRVCDCCPTSSVAVPGGILVAYRDRSSAEARDISLVRRTGGRWSRPYPLHADGWIIAGCPVNGPVLAAAGDRVAAAWFTGAGDAPRVLAAFSQDGGAHFAAPVVVDDAAPIGRVRILMLADGSALVAWLGSATRAPSGNDGAILAARVSATGVAGRPVRIARASAGRASGMPGMALAGDVAVFAWTEAAPGSSGGARPAATRVRMAMLPLGQGAGAPR
jgi:hypothetical protein